MRILITNDDGIHAPGLQAMENIARALSDDVALDLPAGVFLNVNFPDVEPDQVKGVRITRQGWRKSAELVPHAPVDARGFDYLWLSFLYEPGHPEAGTDLEAVLNGYISVTPLHCDLTHRETHADLLGQFDR